MTRYYYDVCGVRDTEGLAFETFEEAKEHAATLAHSAARENTDGGVTELDLVVRDGLGERFIAGEMSAFGIASPINNFAPMTLAVAPGRRYIGRIEFRPKDLGLAANSAPD
jgi:hypothetical protein